MKLSNIFTLVLVLHVVAIVLIFVQPGCQSSPRPEMQSQAMPSGGEIDTIWSNQADSGASMARPTGGQTTDRSAPTRPASTGTGVPRFQAEQPPLQPVSRRETAPPPLSTTSQSSRPQTSGGSYTVQRGDTLWGVAQKNGVALDSLLSANGLSRNSLIRPGQELVLPRASGSASSAVSIPSSTTRTEGTVNYTVRRGDTLSGIAARNGTTVASLRSMNNLRSDQIGIGQVLRVPGSGSVPSSEEGSRGSPSVSPPANGRTHTVRSGETPGAIASTYGVSSDDLMRVNNISDPRRIQVGQELRIPGPTSASSAPSQQASSPSQPGTATPPNQSSSSPPRLQERGVESGGATPLSPGAIPIIPEMEEVELIDEDDFPLVPILPEGE